MRVTVYNDIQYCIETCDHAEDCLGAELYRKMVKEISP